MRLAALKTPDLYWLPTPPLSRVIIDPIFTNTPLALCSVHLPLEIIRPVASGLPFFSLMSNNKEVGADLGKSTGRLSTLRPMAHWRNYCRDVACDHNRAK